MADLDQGGIKRFSRAWCGPTLGWQFLPVAAETIATTAAPITVVPGMAVILIKLSVAAAVAIALPDVNLWVKQSFDLGTTRSNFDRSLLIKDIGGTASGATPITVTPFAGQKIDNQNSVAIQALFAWAKLFPLDDLSGWYMGA